MVSKEQKNKQFIETGVATDLPTAIMADLVNKPGSKEAFWKLVELLMDHLYNHPNLAVKNGMKELEAEAKHELDGTFNEFGATKKLEMRKLMLLPDRLLMALIRVYGSSLPISQKEFQRGMWLRYPKLRTSNKY